MEVDLTQKLTTAEKARGAKVIKTMKQQVSHERHLKLDAFHEVDKLINQVSTLCVSPVIVICEIFIKFLVNFFA